MTSLSAAPPHYTVTVGQSRLSLRQETWKRNIKRGRKGGWDKWDSHVWKRNAMSIMYLNNARQDVKSTSSILFGRDNSQCNM